MRCPKCGSDGVIQIKITLHTEERLDFRSCHHCEHKFWETAEDEAAHEVLGLSEVLTRAKVVKKTA